MPRTKKASARRPARKRPETLRRLAHEPREEPWGSLEFAVIDPDGFRITFAN